MGKEDVTGKLRIWEMEIHEEALKKLEPSLRRMPGAELCGSEIFEKISRKKEEGSRK